MSEKSYLIVNPKGIMHVVSEEHARQRLKLAGWRLASPDEKKAYFEASGNQRFDRPLASPFSPQPLEEEALSEAEMLPTKKSQPEPGVKAEAAKKGKVSNGSEQSDQREVSA